MMILEWCAAALLATIFAVCLWLYVGFVLLVISTLHAALGAIARRLNPPPPPFCDIDPLCHPGFVWRPDGSGWIGPCCVIAAPMGRDWIQELQA